LPPYLSKIKCSLFESPATSPIRGISIMTIAASTQTPRPGQGLGFLLPRVQPTSVPSAAEAEGGKPREIPLEQIDRNPFQTRSRMNEEQLASWPLHHANGVVQPILVRPWPTAATSSSR